MEEWKRELVALAGHGDAALNQEMARHISAVGLALSRRAGVSKPPVIDELARQMGRGAISFREFVQAHRAELSA